MKKLYCLSFLIVSLFFLIACGTKSVPVEIISHEKQTHQVVYHIALNKELKTIEALTELAQTTVAKVYEPQALSFGLKTYQFDIYFYKDNQKQVLYGSLHYVINKDSTSPGLNLKENLLLLP